MRAHCVLLATVVATTAIAQSDDIYGRLRTVLASSGEAEVASTALANRDFARLEQMLARLKPETRAERSELMALRGAVEFLNGKIETAAIDFQKASELGPLRDPDTFTFAMAQVNVGDETHARQLLTGLADKHPSQAIYIYWLGRLDYSQRRYQDAVEKLRRASELDSQSARTWDSLGLAFDMQGRMNEALEAFQKAAALNRVLPHASPWPPHDLGFLLLRLDHLGEADASLREALRYDPHLAQAHYHLGRALEKEARETEAIEEYRSAISADAANSDACYSLAMLYRKLHRDTDASAMFVEYQKRKQVSRQATAKSP